MLRTPDCAIFILFFFYLPVAFHIDSLLKEHFLNSLPALSTYRLLSLQSENVTLRSDLSQAQADLSSQVEAQRQTYREQLRKLQDDHRATVETLQGQLTRVEEQLFTLQSQNSKHGGVVVNLSQYLIPYKR